MSVLHLLPLFLILLLVPTPGNSSYEDYVDEDYYYGYGEEDDYYGDGDYDNEGQLGLGAALFHVLLALGGWMAFYLLFRFRNCCACDQGRHSVKVASSDFSQRDGQNTVFEGTAWKTKAHPADKNWGIVFFLLVTAALTFLEIMYTLVNGRCYILLGSTDTVPILVIVCYGIYLEVCRRSGVYKSFLHMLPKEKVEKYMVKVNEERVKISFHIICSHEETHTRQVQVSYTNDNGNTETRTETETYTETVVTYDETVGLDYGECVNHEKNATGINRGHYDVILCKTIPVIRYENGKSDEESLQRYKNKLFHDNKHRDTNCSVSRHDCLDSLEPMQMIKYTDSCMLTKGTFEIFAYALLGWFYIWWVGDKAGQCEIVVIKTLKDVARWERGGGGGGGGEKSPVTSNSGVATGMMPMQGGMPMTGTQPGMQPMLMMGAQQGMQSMPMMQPGMTTLQQQPMLPNEQMPGTVQTTQSMLYEVTFPHKKLGVGFNKLPGINSFYVQRNESGLPVEVFSWLHAYKTQGCELKLIDDSIINFEDWENSIRNFLQESERPITLVFKKQPMQQPMLQPPANDPTVPMIAVKVPIYGGGGSVTSEYNGKLVMVEIPKDATPGADIMVPVPEGYR